MNTTDTLTTTAPTETVARTRRDRQPCWRITSNTSPAAIGSAARGSRSRGRGYGCLFQARPFQTHVSLTGRPYASRPPNRMTALCAASYPRLESVRGGGKVTSSRCHALPLQDQVPSDRLPSMSVDRTNNGRSVDGSLIIMTLPAGVDVEVKVQSVPSKTQRRLIPPQSK